MPTYAYLILVLGWVLWLTPFFRARQAEKPAKQVDRRARWGILLVAIAYTLLWQGHFWERSPQPWQVALSIVLFVLASLLSWTGARALGRQWRIDAGLSADHELVMSGPYRFVRHPIYTSLLCILLGTGFLITPRSSAIDFRNIRNTFLLTSHFPSSRQRAELSPPSFILCLDTEA